MPIFAPSWSQSILESSSMGFAVLAIDGRYLEANPSFCKLLGRAHDQVIGASCLDITHPSDQAQVHQLLCDVRNAVDAAQPGESPRILSSILRHLTPTGSVHTCRHRWQLHTAAEGPPVLLVQCEQIDDELQRVADLERSEARTSTVINHLPAMIALWDRDLRNVFANSTYVDYFGWKPEDLRGHHIQEVLGDDLWMRNKGYLEQALAGKAMIFERTIRDTSGHDRNTVASYVPSWFNGEVEGVTVFVTDQTELKAAMVARFEAQRDLQLVLDAAIDFLVVATDRTGVMRVFNRGAERMLGYAAHDVVGCATPLLIHDTGELEARARELTAQTGVAVEGFEVFTQQAKLGLTERREWTLVGKDGRRVPVSLVVSPMVDLDGGISGYLGIGRDISAEVEARRQTEAAMQAAESANRAKSQFLANMSHEIRTPMNAVLGVTELLAESELNPQQAEYAAMILTAGRSLLQIINDILDISKIEAGKMEVERAPFNMLDVLKSVEGILSLKAHEKGLVLACDMPAQVPALVVGDGVRLQQVLVNLVSNAIKFTHHGEVRLSVTVAPGAQTDQTLWHFCVSDTGIGMDPGQLQRIFQPFVQASSSSSRQYGGTGLGLTICKSLVELMGGTLEVASIPDRGSHFRFAIALAPLLTEGPLPERAPPSACAGRR
jgi:PAS domain S-box-containing protein